MGKTQAPLVHPLPELSARELRFGHLWRTVALLADQAAEIKGKYPNSISADLYQKRFQEALDGLLKTHAEFWNTAATRDSEDARRQETESEAHWLIRAGLKASDSAKAHTGTVLPSDEIKDQNPKTARNGKRAFKVNPGKVS